jgi:RHS repeat-associated protein
MISKTGIGGWEVLTWKSGIDRPRIRPETVRFDLEVAGVAQRNIVYNQDQKPVQITYQGGITNLTYDGAGSRIKKVKGSETVIYVGGIYEIRDGQAMSHVFANGRKIVTLTNNKEYYTHSDHLGSTSVVTDENGTIVEEIGYLPFGATLFRNVYNGSSWESAYRFTGQEFDEEYHLYNYNARLYDPIMCRFITPDTIMPRPYDPQSLNRYSYCTNNPLRYVDPSGHSLLDWIESFKNAFKFMFDFFRNMMSTMFSGFGSSLGIDRGFNLGKLGDFFKKLFTPRKIYREVEATRDKIIFIGIEPSVVGHFKGSKYDDMFQDWANNPDITIDEDIEWEELKSALKEYDAVFLITHNTSSNKLMFKGRDKKFSNLDPSEIKAKFLGFAVCNHTYHFKQANKLAPSRLTVMDFSVPKKHFPKETLAFPSLNNIYIGVNSYLTIESMYNRGLFR